MAAQWTLTARGGMLRHQWDKDARPPLVRGPFPLQESLVLVLGRRAQWTAPNQTFVPLSDLSRSCRLEPACWLEIDAAQQQVRLLGPNHGTNARAARYVHVDHAHPAADAQWACPVHPGSLVQVDDIVMRIDYMRDEYREDV
jgi:hypothetical protein